MGRLYTRFLIFKKFFYFNSAFDKLIAFSHFSLVVGKGMYTIHSGLVPFSQENYTLNFCWRGWDGEVFLKPQCHVFIAHVPALHVGDYQDSVSFESACLPGYYLRQKNYRILIQKRDETTLFGKILLPTSCL